MSVSFPGGKKMLPKISDNNIVESNQFLAPDENKLKR